MPKIERSVAYTFDAYSGGLKNEALGKRDSNQFRENIFKRMILNYRRNDETSKEELRRVVEQSHAQYAATRERNDFEEQEFLVVDN